MFVKQTLNSTLPPCGCIAQQTEVRQSGPESPPPCQISGEVTLKKMQEHIDEAIRWHHLVAELKNTRDSQ